MREAGLEWVGSGGGWVGIGSGTKNRILQFDILQSFYFFAIFQDFEIMQWRNIESDQDFQFLKLVNVLGCEDLQDVPKNII